MPDDDSAVSGEVMSSAYDGPGEWLPAAEAARRIGVSERTLWRYVDAGRYRKQTRAGRAQVWVPVTGTTPDDTTLAVPAAPDTLSVAIIEELRRQHQESAERLTRQAARIEELAAARARAEAERDAARRRADELAAELEQARRPWWRRLW